MKKTYIQPTCEVVELKMQTSVLVLSKTETSGLGTEKLTFGEGGEESKTGDAWEDSW